MNRGTAPGTVLGEVARFFWQFKSFPITVLHKQLGRELFGKGATNISEALVRGRGDILGLSHLIVATTLFGYLAMAAKDTFRGRKPRDFRNPKTVIAAMAQGGGLGIYGDFLFGEYSRFGKGFLSTLAGPTFAQIDDLHELWIKLRSGDDVAGNLVRLAMNNTPFINLFYTRFALDYLILFQIQELINPGYLRRMEARIRRDRGQKFHIPPSTVIPRGGGDRPFESIL